LNTKNLAAAFDSPLKLRQASGRYSLQVFANRRVVI